MRCARGLWALLWLGGTVAKLLAALRGERDCSHHDVDGEAQGSREEGAVQNCELRRGRAGV